VVAPRKSGKLGKAILVTVAGLILAVVIVGSLISRQNLRGAQSRSHSIPAATQAAPAVAPQPAAPREQPPAPAVHATKPAPPAVNEAVNPEVSSRQILNGPVRTLWESGRYAQALAYVNQVLATDPDNEDARSWKKKIREAQAAEAALK
jgi:hypothetical protein